MKIQILSIISILLIVLLVVGCGTKQIEQTAEPEQKTTVQTEKTEVQSKPAETPQINTPVVETTEKTLPSKPVQETVRVEESVKLSPILKELLEKSDYKIKSYQYLLAEPPANRFLDTYYVKDDKIKIKIFEENAYKLGEYYDTIYLDRANHRATARCENQKRCVTGGMDYTKKVFEVDYNKFNPKTPMEWLKEITYAEIVGPEVVDARSATKIKSVQNGLTTEMWVHNTYGLPLKVQVTHQDGTIETYQFTDSQFNSLRDIDVMPLFETEKY